MRSTLKCDIIYLLHRGIISMKTKIIYISGNEIFDMNDIRCAFEEVRKALNLDQNTILFGVPVDKDDAEITKDEKTEIEDFVETPIIEENEIIEEPEFIEEETLTEPEITAEETPEEKIIEISEPIKKRGRPKKVEIVETPEEPQIEESENTEEISEEETEKIVPILSILSSKEDEEDENTIEDESNHIVEETIATENVIEEEIIDSDIPTEENEEDGISDDAKSDLEKLLSGVTPLNEIEEELPKKSNTKEKTEETEEENVDLTLEKLASEFIQNQDKIVEEAKNATPGKISKLRKFVPFKKKKPTDDNVFGDLFGWAGQAANDDDFSVPGFFTRTDSKK